MKDIRLKPEALADLASFRRYTMEKWGSAQARSYLSDLGRRFQEIAAGTAAVRPLDEVLPGYWRCRYRSHLIIFSQESSRIIIVRVLHERMDVGSRLGDA